MRECQHGAVAEEKRTLIGRSREETLLATLENQSFGGLARGLQVNRDTFGEDSR